MSVYENCDSTAEGLGVATFPLHGSEAESVMPKTVKKRGHIPEDKLRQVASSTGSLFYETLMLKETAARCVEPTDEVSLEIIVPYKHGD